VELSGHMSKTERFNYYEGLPVREPDWRWPLWKDFHRREEGDRILTPSDLLADPHELAEQDLREILAD